MIDEINPKRTEKPPGYRPSDLGVGTWNIFAILLFFASLLPLAMSFINRIIHIFDANNENKRSLYLALIGEIGIFLILFLCILFIFILIVYINWHKYCYIWLGEKDLLVRRKFLWYTKDSNISYADIIEIKHIGFPGTGIFRKMLHSAKCEALEYCIVIMLKNGKKFSVCKDYCIRDVNRVPISDEIMRKKKKSLLELSFYKKGLGDPDLNDIKAPFAFKYELTDKMIQNGISIENVVINKKY